MVFGGFSGITWPLMAELSIPAVLGMVVAGLCNMIDSIFIGQMVGAAQMGAVSVSYPFTFINADSAAMIGGGSASVLSRAIGKVDETTVKKIMENLVAAVFVMSVVYAVIGMVFTRQHLMLAGASDNILNYAEKYLRIIFDFVFIHILKLYRFVWICDRLRQLTF